MNEVVTLKCLCGNSCVHAGPSVDIAEMLRCALGNGWRRISRDPVRATESDGLTEIELYGQCGNCAGREDNFLDSVVAAPAHSKTLREIIAARRSSR